MVLKPRLSEKSYALSEKENTYVFDIPARANRHDVLRAVAAQYEVGVESVRVAKTAGKTKRSYRNGRGPKSQSSAIRKAYVTLKEGDKLPVFAAIEEANKAEAKAAEKGANNVHSGL